MGFLTMLAPCYCCGNPFLSNPELVPSVRDDNGVRQPMCRDCITKINETRKEMGLDEVRILPGAYEAQEI